MEIKIGKSSSRSLESAVSEATKELKQPKLILFYSGVEAFEEYTKRLYRQFPRSIILGATTFAGFYPQGAKKDALILMGIENGIECAGGVLEEVDRYPLKYVDRVETSLRKIDHRQNTVCFEMTTALIQSEELVLSVLNSVCESAGVPVFGGSAGDQGRAQQTKVSFNGVVYEKACVYAMIHNLGGKIHLYRENIYKPTKHIYKATKVDVRKRLVYELNHKPAAKVVAEALNIPVTSLQGYIDRCPFGRIIGSDTYIIAGKRVHESQAISFHARIYDNSQIVIMEPDDYRGIIRSTIAQIKQEVPNPSGAIMINCLARSMFFEANHYLEDFGLEMAEALGDYVGFAGYGEQLNQQHFNQTMVVAVFE